MSAKAPKPSQSIDLLLAWRRTKHYREDRCFIAHPFLVTWIEESLDAWIKSIGETLDADYSAREGIPCFVPKPNGMLRKGIILDLRDEVVLTALVGDFYKKIWDRVRWSQGGPDMAYRMREPSTDVEWIENRLANWIEWTSKSLKLLDDGYKYVLFTDITNFYDNIDLNLLDSNLKDLGLESGLITMIASCLYRWSLPNGKGIPQGVVASDILAKLYMNSVDQSLLDHGLVHLRYVDDIRIFCGSKNEAKRALFELTVRLAQKGLSLNGAKTVILPAERARQKIEGVAPVIRRILQDLSKDLGFTEYTSPPDIEERFNEDPSKANPEMFETLFIERFNPVSDADFDKTLFHFLLTRLGRVKSTTAVSYCLHSLPQRPEETSFILKYLAKVPLDESELVLILDFMGSNEAIYDYQLYELVRWFDKIDKTPDKLVKLCRSWAHDKNREPWLRTYSLLILGKAGNDADLDQIKEAYSSAQSALEKAEIVSCLRRMEKTRRNQFFGQAKKDNDLVDRAVRLAKQ